MQRLERNQPEELRWTVNTGHQSADPVANLTQAKSNLANAQKSRLMGSNSAKYNAVGACIDSVLNALSNAFPGADQNPAALIQVHQSYNSLFQACKNYRTKTGLFGKEKARNATFAKGKNRLDLVGNIETLAQNDYSKLNLYFDRMPGLPAQERAKTPQEALQIARTSNFRLKGTWAGQKHLGGAISDLAVINEGDFEGTNVSGLFKKEEIFTVQGPRANFFKAFDKVSEKINLRQDYRDLILEVLNEQQSLDPRTANLVGALSRDHRIQEKLTSSIEFNEFWNLLGSAAYSNDTLRSYMHSYVANEAVNEGDTINLTKLNVASSRIAALLGQGHLVVQSELATMEDSSGAKINGLLMQKAAGREGTAYMKETRKATFKAGGAEAVKELKKIITPQFQKSLADLQVLDNIFGQTDRHSGNYMVQEKNGKLTGVTGIDNDFAFGEMRLGEAVNTYSNDATNDEMRAMRKQHAENRKKGKIASSTSDQHLRYAADLQGNMTIPHMSDGLANAISHLTLSQLEYALADVLSSAQIKGVWGRVQQLQTAIQKERSDPRSNRILKDDQWNDQTLDDFMNDKNQSYLKNYVSDLTNEYAVSSEVTKESKIEQYSAFVRRMLDDGQLKTPESVMTLVKDFGTQLPDKNFLLQSGKLQLMIDHDQPALINLIATALSSLDSAKLEAGYAKYAKYAVGQL